MRSLLLTALLLVVTGLTAAAQVPRIISFQGRARDAQGNYPDGSRSVTIRVLDAETGGDVLFTETQTVSFQKGAFAVLIGLSQPSGIPTEVTFDRPLWLDVAVQNFNGGAPLSPRMRIVSAPSALNAETAEVARGIEPGASVAGSTTSGMIELSNAGGPGLVSQGSRYATIELGIDSTSAHFVSGDTVGSAAAPDPGAIYRDNAPMAWALVAADGTILADFGVASVTHSGTGTYEVVLDNAAVMVANPKGSSVPALAPMIQPSLLGDLGAPLSAQWLFRSGAADQDRHVSVRTFAAPNGTPIATDAAFSIIVFGRPQK
jgi:hypothetical protein